ncbi:MAG: MFS transporter [Candidatus Heimdallarchaeota archaeon]|nr:MFS transporter [Candidatus Heimdallarchaeota archaeon]
MIEEHRSKFRAFLQEITLLLLSTMTVMIGTPLSPGLSKISDHFSGTVTNVEFLTKFSFTIPALTFALFALIIGVLIDKWGRKPVLLCSLILYIISGSMGLYIDNLYAIIVSRAFLGIAAAGNMNTILTLIGDYYDGEKRDRVLGFQVATGALGSVVLALIGGALFDIKWNYPFIIYLLPALLLPTAIFVLKEPKDVDKTILIPDDTNQIVDTNAKHENTCKVNGLSSKWIIAICYGLIFALMFIFYLGPSQISYYIDDLALELSSFQIGIIMAAVMLAAAFIGAFYKQFKKFMNFHIISILGFSLLGIGFIILSIAKSFTIFLLAAIIGGIGFGFLLPNFSLYLVSNTTSKNRGKVVSGYNTMWYIGESLSPIIFQPIIIATSYSIVYLIGGIVFFSLLVIPVTLLILYNIKKKQLISSHEKN